MKVTRALLVLPLAAASLQPILAQTAQEPAKSDQVVTLSEFDVSDVKTNDYTASESVTGTRVVSKLRDLPFQVDVITSEFLTDFGAFDISQQLGFVPNVSPSDTDGNFVLRGFASTPFIDGFRRTNSIDLSDIQRIEIIKGPSASIYGQTLPGGVVNYITKKPQTTPHEDLSISLGSYDFLHAAASSTGPIGHSHKFFYLIDASDQFRKFAEQYASQHTAYVSATLLYKPDDNTSVELHISGQKAHNHDRNAIPFIKSSTSGYLTQADGVTALKYTYLDLTGASHTANAPFPQVINRFATSPGDINTYLAYIKNPSAYGANGPTLSAALQTTNSWDRLATNLWKLRTDGPEGFTDYDVYSATGTLEHRYNRVFSTRATIDAYDRPYHRQYESGNQLYYTDPNFPDGEVGASTPTFVTQAKKGYSGQIDNLAAFNLGPVTNKFLVTFDFNDSQAGNVTRSALSSGTNATTGAAISDKYVVTDPVTGIKYPAVLPLGPRSTGPNSGATPELPWPLSDANYYYPTYAQYPQMYNQIKLDNWSESDDYGLFASERAGFFHDRVFAFIGGRYDDVRNNVYNYLAAPTDPSRHARFEDHAFTYQSGLTAYLLPNLVAFANDSTAYNPNPQVVTVHNADGSYSVETLPNERGSGYEYGARYSLFDQRLNLMVTRFDIDRKNKVDSFTDEFGITEYVGSGEQRSKGYEFEANWAVNESLQLLTGFGYNDARYVHSTLPYLVGTTTPQNAKENVSVAVRYQITHGALAGLSFIGGLRYYSKSLVSVGSGGVITTDPFATGGFHPALFNVPLYNGTLPFKDLPAGVAILSRNATIATDTSGINPSTGGTGIKNSNVNKGYTTAPAGWVQYTPGTTMASGTQYYVWDGDGQTNASYTRTTSVDDGRSNVDNLAYAIYNFGVSYRLKSGRHFSQSIRLTLNNAFNKFYTYGSAAMGYPREWQGSYSVNF